MRRVLLVLLSLCLFLPARAGAQVPGEVVLTGVVVGQLIDRFEAAASRLLFEGENRGNALLVAMGNQLRVGIRNAELAMQGQQNTLYERLGTTQQSFFTELNAIVRAASGPVDRAISVLEVANLNLIELTNRLPLTEKTYTYINRLDGLTQVHRESAYRLSAHGLGFGQDGEDRAYRIAVILDGREVPASAVARTPPYALDVRLDPQILEPHFSDTAIVFVPLEIRADVRARERCWLLFRCEKTSSVSWPLRMTLLPRYAGELTGVEIVRDEELDGVTRTTSVDVTTRGCETDSPCDWSRTIQLAANERVVGIRYACSGQCGWSYNLRRGGYSVDYDILEDSTKVVVYRHVDGENSTTVTHYVDYQTLKPVITERPLEPVKLRFDEVALVRLSPGNTACAYRLTASLVTGQRPFIDNSMSASADGLLARVGTGQGPAGAACTPSFELNVP